MKPILYKANETTFETYGLGEIDATKALVTRERNGNYTLYIEYPASGRLASVFKTDMRIKSDAGLRTKNQTFYISRIVKSSKGIIKIYAKHISHLTEIMAIRNKTLVNGTASSALSIWASNTLGGVRFDTWSDITASSRTSWDIANIKNAREALGGKEGSILDVWGGEFEFDNTTIRLHKQLGRKSPIVLEYGRNILSAEDEQDIEATYTSIYPYATYTPESTGSTDGRTEAITVELPEKYIDSKYVGLYNERRVEIVDFSSSFKEKEVPTSEKLKSLANAYIINNNVGLPKINTKIEYVDLSNAQDHASNRILEEAELCDIVPIYYPPIGITSEDGKLTTIVFDVLRGVNDSVEVGTIGEGIRSAMTSGLATQVSDIAKSQKRLVDNLPKYLVNAQGNKIWYNKPDANIEHKVGDIWFEKNGLYDRMYIWDGSQWEKRIDTEDVDKVKKEVDRQLEEAKTTTDRAIAEANVHSSKALAIAGAGVDLGREAKEIANENVRELNAFRTNVQIEREKLSDELKRYSREETTNQITTLRERFSNGYVAKSTYVENVESTKQRFEALTKANEAKLAEFRQGIDGQLTTLSSQIANKVNEIDFQKVKETSLLYERILGKSEADAPDKLSRLVMSSEIFQTEVGKYSTQGGPNMLRNSRADDGLKYWIEANGRLGFTAHSFYFNGQKRMFELRPGAVVKSPRFIVKRGANYMLNMLGFDNNSKSFKIYFCKRKKGSTADFEEKQVIFEWSGNPIFNTSKAVKKSFKFNVGDFDDGYLQFEYLRNDPNRWGGLFMTELDFYEGDNDRKWKPAPEDSAEPIEAVRTQMTLLSDSWSIRNLNSAGDVLGAINLNPDGSVRINEGLLSVGEKTIIKDGVIKKSMIGKAQIGTAHIDEIDASKANLINVTAKNVATEGLTANIIKGGKLSSLNGVTDFDLQTGWIDMNTEAVGIRNRFNGKPMQFLVFGQGALNGVPCAYTQLMSNRNGTTGIEHTSAGIQIWNGRQGNNVQTAITFYGRTMDFSPSSVAGGVTLNTETKEFYGLNKITTGNIYLSDYANHNLKALFNDIYENIRKLHAVKESRVNYSYKMLGPI